MQATLQLLAEQERSRHILRFSQPLIEGRLVRRRKKYEVDVKLDTGECITVQCLHPGSMLGCSDPNSRVLLSSHDHPRRRFQHQLEIVYAGRTAVGVHAGRPIHLLSEAIANNKISEVLGYAHIQRKTQIPRTSCVDMILQGNGLRPCNIALCNVTFANDGHAYYPDTTIANPIVYFNELINLVRKGERAMLCYLVQRADVTSLRLADHIDADYCHALRDAIARGVEILCYKAKVNRKEIEIDRKLSFECHS